MNTDFEILWVCCIGCKPKHATPKSVMGDTKRIGGLPFTNIICTKVIKAFVKKIIFTGAKKTITMEHAVALTNEEKEFYDQKASQLAAKYNCTRIHPVVFIQPETGEKIEAYLKEPSFMQKIAVADKTLQTGAISAADELREAILLKEESHTLTYAENYTADVYKMGVNFYISQNIITIASNKKK